VRSPARIGFTSAALFASLLAAISAAQTPTPAQTESGAGSWRYLPTVPLGRYENQSDYDPIGDRLLVHGGWSGTATQSDSWGLAFSSSMDWSLIQAPGAPSLRDAAHVFDPVRNRWVMFGGASFFQESNATYALSLAGAAAWSTLAPTGTVPSAREGVVAIRDSKRDRLVIFGGWDGGSHYRNDVSALDLASAAWGAFTVAGTPPTFRSLASAIYDASRDRMILFGGRDSASVYQEVWSINFSDTPTWTLMSTSGTPPVGRYAAAAAYDSLNDRMIVFGGSTSGGPLADTWSLSLPNGAWTQLDSGANGPPPRSGFSSAFDSRRRRLLVFGGAYGLRDTWALSLDDPTHWTLLDPGYAPVSRSGEAAVIVPQRDRMYLFGGRTADGGTVNTLSELHFGEDRFTELHPIGSAPPPSGSASLIHDVPRDRLIVFGGTSGSSGVWSYAFDPPTWTPLVTSGTSPGPRSGQTSVYDSMRQRMLVFGGGSDGDVYALDLATTAWSKVNATGGPGSRSGHAAIYDPPRDRMLVVGGNSTGAPDVWSLALAGTPTWTQLTATGTAPSLPVPFRGAYDPMLDRMVIYGGNLTRFDLAEPFALSLSGSPVWTRLADSPVPNYSGTVIAFDPTRDRLLLHGGIYVTGLGFVYTQDELFELSFAASLPVPDPIAPGGTRIANIRPNPGRGEQTIEFDVAPGAGTARLQIFAVTGQRVRVWSVAGRGAHTVVWNGVDSAGRPCAPGVYWAALRTPTATRGMRFVRVR